MENKPVAGILDYETGEITNEINEGDKVRVIKESQSEYYNLHTVNWGNGRPFVKVYTDLILYMKKELTKTEFSTVFLLLPHTSYEDCIIREDGTTRNSHMLDLREICDVIGEKYDNGRRLIRSLYLKGVIGRFSTMVIYKDEDVKEKEVYFMNPYLLFKGSDILNSVLELFEQSLWHRYYMELENKD